MNCLEGSKFAGRLIIVVLIGLAVAACTTPSAATNGESEKAPPIEADSPEVAQAFDEALQLLQEGQWDEAVDAFRLLQAEHAGDPIAEVAELYVARAMMGDLDRRFGTAEADEVDGIEEPLEEVSAQVFALLEPLATSQQVDERIRYASRAYLATAHAANDDLDAAIGALRDYPGASMSPVVLDDDRRWLWPLIAEGLGEAGRHGPSVVAWGKLHVLILEEAERKEAEERGEDDEEGERWFVERSHSPKADLAVTRAFEAERYLSDEDVRIFLRHDEPLVRAVGAWTFIRRGLSEELGEEGVAAIQDVFNDLSPAFLTIGAADRAAELSAAIAGVSGADRLVVGALLPLSGPNRAVGYRALAGMLVAQRAFHVAGEPTVTLIIEDSHGDLEGAYERLVAEEVLAVVGPLATNQARQLAELAGHHQVPVIALAADRLNLEKHGARGDEDEDIEELPIPLFRNFVDAVAEARAAAVIAFERLGERRAAVVYPDMGYGRVMAQAFGDEFRRRGGEVVVEVQYDRQATDYVDVAKRVARTSPDAIFIPDTGGKVAEVTAFFAQEQIWGVSPESTRRSDTRTFVQYLGTSLWQDPVLLHQAASYVEGAIVPAWYSPVFADSDVRQFSQGFEAIYGGEADHFVAFAYDSVNRLRTLLLERGATDSRRVAEALRQPELERGATGRYYFGDDGEPRRELRYLLVEGGDWAIYDETVMTPVGGRDEVDKPGMDEEIDELEAEAGGS